MANGNSKREVAWRVFAREFNSATTSIPGDEQYAPSYVLSPIGAMINRVYITGVLTECENVGTEQEPLWRGRVSDPTDVFYISAGQFQPKAARALSELEVPALVGVTGKARTYSPDETTTYVSVRVEFLKQITQELRDYWVLEACQSLQYRLGAVKEALKMEPANLKELTALGYSKKLSEGILETLARYGDLDFGQYQELLVSVLSELNIETSMDITVMKDQTTKTELANDIDMSTGRTTVKREKKYDRSGEVDLSFKPASATVSVPDEEIEAEEIGDEDQNTGPDPEVSEQLLFEIINTLSEDNPDGIEYEEVEIRATAQGIAKEVIDECLTSLIDKGIIYEPSIGLFKAVT